MSGQTSAHIDQVAYWNDRGGQKWIGAQARTDIMLAPVSKVLLEHARPELGSSVLDIGCGCGATVIEIAKAVGPGGHVLALDVSRPMLDFARSRLASFPQVELVCDDASTYPFDRSADLIVSRFGVMFFGDPMSAFANIGKAIKPDGRLVFACWRKFEENPWMQVPLHAAYDAGVPQVARPGPEEPGPFSFANPERVTKILTGAGFKTPRFTPFNLSLDIAAGDGLSAAVDQAITIGATSRALQDQPDNVREAAWHAVEKVLTPYVTGQGVFLPAAIWVVESELA